MLRVAASRAGHPLRRLALQSPSASSRSFCSRREGRNLPIAFWSPRGMGRGPWWGEGDPVSRMMDRHMRQMERVMDEVMSGVGGRMWGRGPRWAEWGPFATASCRGAGRGEVQAFKYNEKEFEVKVDVSSFKPEELNVKIAKDRLTVSGKHEEKPDEHGYVSREFTRHFEVPENVEGETMETLLTEEGVLVVRAKVKGAENAEERTLNIQREPPKEDSGKDS